MQHVRVCVFRLIDGITLYLDVHVRLENYGVRADEAVWYT